MESGMGRTKSKTLSQGVLIFAFNNEATDYIAMAAWSAKNIRRHLELACGCGHRQSRRGSKA
jgi:hypothetical protein